MKSATLVSNFVLLSQDHFHSLVFCDLIQQNMLEMSPGLGNGEPERTTLVESLQGLTSLFLQSSLFIGARNKELRAYSQQNTYKARI